MTRRIVNGVLVAMCVLETISMAYVLRNAHHEYADCGVVTEINDNEDYVTLQMQNGNEFTFYGAEDYMTGDLVAVIMNSNGTQNVKDDEILSCKYVGYVTDEEMCTWIK